jgi:hypothetical protein
MKLTVLLLGIVINIFTFSLTAHASQEPVSSSESGENQAINLVTEPVTIKSSWDQNNENHAVLFKRDAGCEQKGILDYLKNPQTLFQECPEITNPSSRTIEPVGETKLPHLNSGVSVTVTKF